MPRPSDFPAGYATADPTAEIGSPNMLGDEVVQGEGDGETAALEKLDIVSAALAGLRDEWVTTRAAQGHDPRWAEDLAQYNGQDQAQRLGSQMMDSVQQGFPVTSHRALQMRSTVFVQVTRQRTNATAARLADVVLPTDDRNFSVGPTPLPEMPMFVQVPSADQGAPSAAPAQQGAQPSGAAGGGAQLGGAGAMAAGPGPAGAAAAPGPGLTQTPVDPETQKRLDEYTEAKKRGDAMQQEIEDCLEEAGYNAEARKCIFDEALYGAGVMKGPVVVNRTRKAWQMATDQTGQPMWSLEIVKELKPASFRINPRNFFPDPLCGEDIQNGRGAFEYEKKTIKQVRDLLKQPGYIETSIRKVIEEGPLVGKAQVNLGELEDHDLVPGQVYEHWIYWGEIDAETLEAAGIDLGEDAAKDGICACVEMINSTIVRAYVNPLPDGALPYDVAVLERIPGSCWGYGVPYLMRAQQRVINAAWRMILDNAGVSSGPQIVIKAGQIQPADKQWTLTPRKIWYANSDVDDVSKAFTTFSFDSHQAELQAIIELAEKLSDQETAAPSLSPTTQGPVPETVGGMQLQMQGETVMLKRQVKLFDDSFTKPHMRRYYHYLMEYSPKSEIKGDFEVVALGSSSLVVRDIQNQALTNMLALGTNPAYAPLINLKKLFEKALKAQHLDPVDVMNTDAQIQAALQAAQQNRQPDPRVAAAEMRAQADVERTHAQVEMNRETLANKHDIAMQDLAFRHRNLEIEREIEILKLAQMSKSTIEQVRASLAGTAIKVRAQADMHALDIQAEAAQGGEPKQTNWQ